MKGPAAAFGLALKLICEPLNAPIFALSFCFSIFFFMFPLNLSCLDAVYDDVTLFDAIDLTLLKHLSSLSFSARLSDCAKFTVLLKATGIVLLSCA